MAAPVTTLSTFALSMIIASIVLTVASLAISLYQMLSYEAPEPPVPSAQAISYIPTAEQGKAIPVVFGTRVVTTPNVVWWDHARSVKNKVDAASMQ